MVSAYILIQTEVGKAAQVTQQVSGIDGVVAVDPVTGPYDVVARAEADDLDGQRGEKRRAGLAPAMGAPGYPLLEGGAAVVAGAGGQAHSRRRAT